MKIKRALISVSDKTGLEALVKTLDKLGVEIISTGGTAKAIASMGVKVVEISSYTGFPEMLDGRVKTLHPRIHAGLLALRGDKKHEKEMRDNGLSYIDMVVVNLYPFEETVAKKGVTEEEAIENIDIGGPSMLRSAAKNYRSVAVVSSSAQYGRVMDELVKNNGALPEELLKELAVEVFKKTSHYDGAIHRFLSGASSGANAGESAGTLEMDLEKKMDLRYGENPHQKGAFYKKRGEAGYGIAALEKLQGKELSFNNIMDIDSAVAIVSSFREPAVSIVKHNNPCGAAEAGTLEEAFADALDCDRMSAFGSIIALNKPVTRKTAEVMMREATFIECVIAPEYDNGALEVFGAKKNIRVLKLPALMPDKFKELDIKTVLGGYLVQDRDNAEISLEALKTVTKNKAAGPVMASLLFAWKIVRFVKSNAIVLARGTKTVGIGAGQMSRVDSVTISIRKAGDRAKGAVLASDAFFPMPDSIEEAHKAGITAIIQPGGSIRDDEVIAACDKYGIPMIFTGMRHFRH